MKLDEKYTLECACAAKITNALSVVVYNTSKLSMPWEMEKQAVDVVRFLYGQSITIGVHAHNDCGTAMEKSGVFQD